MTLDEQEALSSAYAFGVRILPLTSGRFAILDNTALAAITETIDPAQIISIHKEQVDRYNRELHRPPRQKLTGAQLLKELGL